MLHLITKGCQSMTVHVHSKVYSHSKCIMHALLSPYMLGASRCSLFASLPRAHPLPLTSCPISLPTQHSIAYSSGRLCHACNVFLTPKIFLMELPPKLSQPPGKLVRAAIAAQCQPPTPSPPSPHHQAACTSLQQVSRFLCQCLDSPSTGGCHEA